MSSGITATLTAELAALMIPARSSAFNRSRIYRSGMLGLPQEEVGEEADDHELFDLLNRLGEMVNKDSKTGVEIYTWPQFCKLAVDANEQK